MKLERINLTIRDKATRCAVARVYEGGTETDAYATPQEATALANLLTAAPDLLAALERTVELLDAYTQGDHTGRPWLYEAKQVIAKAKGAA